MSTSTLTATGAVTDSPDAAAWAAWHAEREEGLRPPHGWLSLVAYHWLPAEPAALPGVPGLWWADADGAHHRASEGRAVRTATGDDVTSVVVAEGGSSVAGTVLPDGRDPPAGAGPGPAGGRRAGAGGVGALPRPRPGAP